MLITDAQAHIWEVDRPDRPWPKEVSVTPHRVDGCSAEQMLAEMDAIGVNRAVIVPPGWIGDNNATALEASAAYPGRFAVMGRFNPLAVDARAQLERWLRQPHMLGIRMTFSRPPFRDWLEDGSLEWFWADCERLGIPLMVFVPGNAEKLNAIAGRHPGLTLIIDHMGLVLDQRGAEAFAGLDKILAQAAHPKVCIKVTSAPNFSEQPYPFSDLQPYLRRICDSFGPRRMQWGSDITRLAGSYGECLGLFQESLDFLSAEDKEWVLGKAVAQVLRWPEAGE